MSIYTCPSDNGEKSNTSIIRSVDVMYPTVIIDDVSVKLPKSVSNFSFSGFRIIGRAPVINIYINNNKYLSDFG